MRRLVVSLVASCGLAVLAACAGGYGLTTTNNSSSPDRITFSTVSGQLNGVLSVAPNGNSPILVTGLGVKNNGYVAPDATSFSWAATYGTAATTYQSNVSGVTKPCTAPAATPPIPLFTASGGVYTAGSFSSQIGVAPVPGVAAPYCLIVVATAPSGQIGSFVVIVSNTP